MPNVTFNGNTYNCVKAIKGTDYVHLLDSNGVLVVSFDGVSDFSGFTITDGNWSEPSAASCCVAVINEDGTISRGGRIANSVVLTATGWNNNTQRVNLSGMTNTKNIVVSPNPTSLTPYGESGVYCSAQGNGTLTFVCSDTPTEDLTVNILVIGG